MERLINADCLLAMRDIPDGSVDAIVTDPPAGIAFMGKEWDEDKGGRDHWIKWMQEVATECKRVLKHGGHALVWTLPRTSHWTATAWENAGFEIRDVVAHVFGSGFPKSLNIGKSVDKLQGNEREDLGKFEDVYVAPDGKNRSGGRLNAEYKSNDYQKYNNETRVTKGTSEWEGWGTALKPAREDWLLLRKPLEKGLTIAENCLKWGVGGIQIDECRIKTDEQLNYGTGKKSNVGFKTSPQNNERPIYDGTGRFPSHLIHDGSDEVVSLFPSPHGAGRARQNMRDISGQAKGIFPAHGKGGHRLGDSGSASRFFMCCSPTLRHDTMSICKHINVNIVARFLMTIQAMHDPIATKYAEGLRDEQLDQNVRSAITGCEKCVTPIVQELVRIKNLASNPEGLQAIQDSIVSYKNSILTQNLVEIVTKWVNTDTTPTTASLLILFGCVLLATDENTSSEKREAEEGNGEPKRFLYCPKPSKSERNRGCEGLEEKESYMVENGSKTAGAANGVRYDRKTLHYNNHPTVKAQALMEYLIKLVSREGHIILDPFAGSGSTLVACVTLKRGFIGIERELDYFKIAQERILNAQLPLL